MTIHLDHFLVPTQDRVASARQLAELLGVAWAATGVGPFSPVYVNDGLTLDFDQADAPYPVNTQHGGRIVYWSQPGGHVWELLTVSYERQKAG